MKHAPKIFVSLPDFAGFVNKSYERGFSPSTGICEKWFIMSGFFDFLVSVFGFAEEISGVAVMKPNVGRSKKEGRSSNAERPSLTGRKIFQAKGHGLNTYDTGMDRLILYCGQRTMGRKMLIALRVMCSQVEPPKEYTPCKDAWDYW